MTTIHNKRISSDEDFTLAVYWTRNDVPVSVDEVRLVIIDADGTVFNVASLDDFITVEESGEIRVVIPQASMPDLAPGPGEYVLAVQETTGARVRVVEGDLSIRKKVVTWTS